MTSSEHEPSPDNRYPPPLESPEWIRAIVRIWMYWRGPVVLYRGRAVSMLPSLAPMTMEDESALPTQLREYLLNAEHRLVEIGFCPPVRARTLRRANLHSCMSLIEHPADGSIGHILVTKTLKLNRLSSTISFNSRFVDGKTISTSNFGKSLRTPPRPEVLGLHLTEVQDPVELYEIHRFRVAERSRSVRQVPLTRGPDPFGYQQAESMEVFEHWQRRKYYRPHGDHELRLTVRGAALSAWRGMFPWRHLAEWSRARQAAAVLGRYRRTRGHARS